LPIFLPTKILSACSLERKPRLSSQLKLVLLSVKFVLIASCECELRMRRCCPLAAKIPGVAPRRALCALRMVIFYSHLSSCMLINSLNISIPFENYLFEENKYYGIHHFYNQGAWGCSQRELSLAIFKFAQKDMIF
jgi:hypothetical protein